MNEKIQAILLKIVLELKKDGWEVDQNWQITLKSEGHVPLAKTIPVDASFEGDEWSANVDTTIDLRLKSSDELTYFPNYTIYATISLEEIPSKDIAYQLDADVAFTDKDVRDDSKSVSAAKKISRLVQDHIRSEYDDYVNQNGEKIKNYKHGGMTPDQQTDL